MFCRLLGALTEKRQYLLAAKPRSHSSRALRLQLEPLEDRLLLSTFLVTNTNDSGPGSLRNAILSVNSDSDPATDRIRFAIGSGGVQTIMPLSGLPTITHPVLIDGSSQPGFAGTPLIELDGAAAGAAVNGLTINAGSSTVKDLAINRFGMDGILLQALGDNRVQGTFIGTDVTGTLALANGSNGIEIAGGEHNLIGGTNPAERNLISGNSNDGVLINGTTAPALYNRLQGNLVGTDITGTLPLANGNNGVELTGTAAYNNLGGTTAGAGNLISANGLNGVLISNPATNNTIQGNKIGTDITGRSGGTGQLLSNRFAGVAVLGSSGELIGGLVPAASNLISNNGVDGILLGSDPSGHVASRNMVQGNKIGTDIIGTAALGNFSGGGVEIMGGIGNLIGGAAPGAGNLISSCPDGILLDDDASANVIQQNRIGTDITGTLALGNTIGVFGFGASNNRIGGTVPDAGNLISGNGADGVLFQPDFFGNPSTGNVLQGNKIGTDITGTASLANGSAGVEVQSHGNVIGGATAGAGNLISANNGDGVLIDPGFSSAGPSGNVVQGNRIGTDITGTAALGNGNGVHITSGSGNRIGGARAGAGNLISGNAFNGILIDTNPFGLSASGNILQGNKIGTDITGTAALPNQFSGINVQGGVNTLIGGTTLAAGNLISGNASDGVTLLTLPSFFGTSQGSFNVLEGNQIGTDITGTGALPNAGNGVDLLDGGEPDNTIGGAAPGAGNLISGNLRNGIYLGALPFGAVAGDLVQGNKIGTDGSGTHALANGGDGLLVFASNTQIGGTSSQAGNLISGNRQSAVVLESVNSDLVQGNKIGTDVTGQAALGNGASGVGLQGAQNNTIGGAFPGAGNLISGNLADGVLISQVSGFFAVGQNLIQGNRIGTDVTGNNPIGNGLNGVHLVISSFNTIGGLAAGAANTIAFNGHDGVFVDSGGNDLVSHNAIFANGNLGIDLNAANSANSLQPAPVLSSAVSTGSLTIFQGTLTTSAPFTGFTLEFFISPPSSPSPTEGQKFLASFGVTTDASGVATFTLGLSLTLPQGYLITATATDTNDNTSEFSSSVVITP